MNDIEALRESERWLEKLRRYRIAADDPDQSDQLVDTALLAVREKLARLAAPAPDVEAVVGIIRLLNAMVPQISTETWEDETGAHRRCAYCGGAGPGQDHAPHCKVPRFIDMLWSLIPAIRALAGTPPVVAFHARKDTMEQYRSESQSAVTFDEEALRDVLLMLKGADGRYVFSDGGGLDETMDAIRPYLRPALTEEQVREALHEPDGMRLFDEECDGWVVDALHRAGLLVTP